jgi:hypothetical protein
MDHKLLAILAAGALAVGVTALWVFNPPRPPEIPEKERRYMYCSKCGQELKYDARRCEGDCMYCGEKGPLVATKESVKKTGLPAGPVERLIPLVLIELTLVVAAVYGYTTWRRRHPVDEPVFPFFCPLCHRKLRFRKSQAGTVAKCPNCRRPVLFPKMPEPAKLPWHARIWQKVKG